MTWKVLGRSTADAYLRFRIGGHDQVHYSDLRIGGKKSISLPSLTSSQQQKTKKKKTGSLLRENTRENFPPENKTHEDQIWAVDSTVGVFFLPLEVKGGLRKLREMRTISLASLLQSASQPSLLKERRNTPA